VDWLDALSLAKGPVSRQLAGPDDYQNLIVLCQGCHLGKAHGIEAQKYKAIFFEYTAQFTVPKVLAASDGTFGP